MGFKERLREEIEYQGLLVKEVSAALGISNSTFLSYIDARGVIPNVETAVKIAQYLGVTAEYLVNGNTESILSESARSESPKSTHSSSSAEKKHLLECYEKLSIHDKEILIKISEAMTNQ